MHDSLDLGETLDGSFEFPRYRDGGGTACSTSTMESGGIRSVAGLIDFNVPRRFFIAIGVLFIALGACSRLYERQIL